MPPCKPPGYSAESSFSKCKAGYQFINIFRGCTTRTTIIRGRRVDDVQAISHQSTNSSGFSKPENTIIASQPTVCLRHVHCSSYNLMGDGRQFARIQTCKILPLPKQAVALLLDTDHRFGERGAVPLCQEKRRVPVTQEQTRFRSARIGGGPPLFSSDCAFPFWPYVSSRGRNDLLLIFYTLGRNY